MNVHELNRAYAMLVTLGTPRYSGDEMTDTKIAADSGGAKASSNPRAMPHYVCVMHPFVAGDLRENSQINTAWSYSDINRLYNYEIGEWSGVRFCLSNLVPSFTGVTALTGPASGEGSGFAAGNYVIQVTASDSQNQYESRVYGVSGAVTLTAGQNIQVV